ncbi:MEDS domain-containing protein [Bacillus sp. FJAT-42376]|uniref:MEDS domain-containing protein n=1 Tax=Bacillus sp. FJAT-42376 TaxID=2014076 RepID=UPI0013DDFC99|nr:MEDS domain-containing protein [Bacillus sp. FJAT-42376]
MDTSIMAFKKDIDALDKGHVLYFIDEPHVYIKNAAAYILSGVEKGEHVFVIENERMFSSLHALLKTSLTKTQLDMVHFVNNFDFYYSNGDFHTPTIVAYFLEVVKPVLHEKQAFRTWAHIEWGELKDIESKLDAYEINAKTTVHEMELLSVCAYDVVRLPETIKGSLLNSHDYLIRNHELETLNRQNAVNE